MIVRMKRLTLLVSNRHKQETLLRLRKLGTVHIRNVTRPSATEISSVEEELASAKKASSLLSAWEPNEGYEQRAQKSAQMPEKVKKILSVCSEREELLKQSQDVETNLQFYGLWGGFDPQDIRALKDKGIFIRLYRAKKSTLKKLATDKKIYTVNEDREYAYLVLTTDNPNEQLALDEVKLPAESFQTLLKRQESLKERLEEIVNFLKGSLAIQGLLAEYISTLKSKQTFLHVLHGMKDEEKFSYLQGFCPAEKVKDIISFSKKQGLGYLIEEPGESEEVPTLIRNPRWISIISPVFKFMNTIPGYREYDISPIFLIFLSIFFAMLIGDAGYGLLFTCLTFFARSRLRRAPAEPFWLIYFFSFATIVWGAITGTWFGNEQIARLPFLSSLVISRIDSFVDDNQNFMIYLCFVIGVVHLSIAHLIVAFRRIDSLKALAELGWILILWGLFFTAGALVLGRPFPGYAGYILIGGFILLLLFLNPQRNIIKAMLSSLITIPLKIISSFSDVVSYLRLFAVGYASVVVANTFNEMAFSLGFNNLISSLIAAFILFFGHTLNIVLGVMAVVVHGIRLNMLEFSGQMGMEWSGREYNPFREK